MQTATIYGLYDPRVEGRDSLRYIGVTIRTLEQRLSVHLATAKREKSYRANWIRSLLADGIRPRIAAIEIVPGRGRAREIELIAEYRANGYRLVNATAGGEGTLDLDPEIQARKSDTMMRHWENPDYRAERMRVAGSPESRARKSAASKRKAQNPEYQAKHRQMMVDRYSDPHEREKQAERMRRRFADAKERERHSESCRKAFERADVRRAIREARTPEWRARIAETLRETESSPEVRAAMSDRAKRVWADPGFRERWLRARHPNCKRLQAQAGA